MAKKTEVTTAGKSFEASKQVNAHGAGYWSARDLQLLLGYSQWRRFGQAIERSVTCCKYSPEHPFSGVGKPIAGGPIAGGEASFRWWTTITALVLPVTSSPSTATGPRFRQRVEAIVEAFSSVQEDLDKERKAIMKQWAKREAQMEWMMSAKVGMYGDLQGIEGLSFSALEDGTTL